jgi:hypothetical protein
VNKIHLEIVVTFRFMVLICEIYREFSCTVIYLSPVLFIPVFIHHVHLNRRRETVPCIAFIADNKCDRRNVNKVKLFFWRIKLLMPKQEVH